jgi:uncharacterized protein
MRPAARDTREDLFILPRGEDRYYLYAPLRRSLALVNGAAASLVARHLEDGTAEAAPGASPILDSLRKQGLIGGVSPSPPTAPADSGFCPHEVTLFPTSRCNLRCRYCYAEAGWKTVDMPWEVARAAIDLVSANAGLLGSRKFSVSFHGGGEPTLAWDRLVQCVEYAEHRAEALGLDAEFFAATNGLLTSAQRAFVAAHFTSLNVSLDGPPDIQDYHRPTADGRGSYADIRETLKDLDARGFHYGVRTTVTAVTVGRMPEIVEHLTTEFRPAYLHMEPVWVCGRCLKSGDQSPSDEAFVAGFLAAVAQARQSGLDVHYSGARVDVLTSKFCGAPGDGFSVLPEGIATSCYEVTDVSDPRAGIFHFGRFDPATETYVFDQDRVAALRGLSVEHLAFCADCFCKWHCAGDCLAKAFQKSGAAVHGGSLRCHLNRALTLARLDEIVETNQAEPPSAETRGGTSRV